MGVRWMEGWKKREMGMEEKVNCHVVNTREALPSQKQHKNKQIFGLLVGIVYQLFLP